MKNFKLYFAIIISLFIAGNVFAVQLAPFQNNANPLQPIPSGVHATSSTNSDLSRGDNFDDSLVQQNQTNKQGVVNQASEESHSNFSWSVIIFVSLVLAVIVIFVFLKKQKVI